MRGYRHPGRYSVFPGESLTFSATVREIRPGGTVVIQRPYIRLDRQPEATRRAYAEECDIRLRALGLGYHRKLWIEGMKKAAYPSS